MKKDHEIFPLRYFPSGNCCKNSLCRDTESLLLSETEEEEEDMHGKGRLIQLPSKESWFGSELVASDSIPGPDLNSPQL